MSAAAISSFLSSASPGIVATPIEMVTGEGSFAVSRETAWRTRSPIAAAASRVDRRQDQGELVASVAVDPVIGSRRAVDRGADRVQQRVAGRVAEAVVVALERVEVHHQQRDRALLGLACLPRRRSALGGERAGHLAQGALEGAVVAEPGEGVGVGSLADGVVRIGVAQGDRRLAGEELDQLEVVAR